MDSVGDRIHDLASGGGLRDLRAIGCVAGFARHSYRACHTGGVEAFVALAEFARGIERREAIVFNQRAALAMIVVQVAIRRGVKDAAKVIEAMPIMAADGGVEGDRHSSRVDLISDFGQ